MERIENFDFNELKISSNEIIPYDTGKPQVNYCRGTGLFSQKSKVKFKN